MPPQTVLLGLGAGVGCVGGLYFCQLLLLFAYSKMFFFLIQRGFPFKLDTPLTGKQSIKKRVFALYEAPEKLKCKKNNLKKLNYTKIEKQRNK